MTKYWIGVASKEHVLMGKEKGLCALNHGKPGPLKRMAEGDYLMYYSNREFYKDKQPFQKFTGICKIGPMELQENNINGFSIIQRPASFLDGLHDAEIRPLLNNLSFVTDIKRWGYKFRFGFFEVTKSDFKLIYRAMQRT